MGLALSAAKAVYFGWPAPTPAGLAGFTRDLAASAHADVALAAVATLAAYAALSAAEGRPRLQRGLLLGFLAFGAATVAYAVASVQVFAFLRSPMTYPLLYLTGDLRSMRSMRASLGGFLSPALAIALVAAPAAYLLLCRASAKWRTPAGWGGVLGGLALLGFVMAGHELNRGDWSDRADHLIARSPHWTLLSSGWEALTGDLKHLEGATRAEDLADFDRPRRPVLSLPRSFGRAPRRPRNVILLVLESLGAEWLGLYGGRYPNTPRLEQEAAAHALVFENFYCHVGLSANSMAALSLSIFPYMTWREYTSEYPDFPGKTLADVLRPRGYRTAFIHSGDLDYVGQDRFLQNRGFDVVWDLKTLQPENRRSDWGGDDHLLMDGVLRWLDQERGRPFYVMAWGIETHFPYEANPAHEWVDFLKGEEPPDAWDLSHYLNTVHDVDGQIGRLIDALRARGLADDTLIAITGDHGEGFGAPHYSWGHGDRIYQENVRVPLVLWSPRLFPKGSRSRVIGGHVDVNPTVANLLGLPADAGWQGRSLFDPERAPRAYFYAARDGYLLGLREGDWKYTYDATHGSEELFDLSSDPHEQADLSAGQPARARRLRQRLAAWREYVERSLPAHAAP